MGNALVHAQGQAVVVRVHSQSAMKAHGGLRQGGVQGSRRRQGERRSVRHVGVQHDRLACNAVHRSMDEHGRGLHRMTARQLLARRVAHHDVCRLHLTPVQASRVEQKPVVSAGHRHAEVVAHALAQALMGGRTQGQRQIFAQRQKGFKGFIRLNEGSPTFVVWVALGQA